VRILYRVLIAERMPESQRLLASLAGHRLELGPDLRTGPLRHSERFILEAMDGFHVDERGGTDPNADSLTTPSVLIAKAAPGPRPQPTLGSGIFLESRDYLLYQSASQIASRTALHRPSQPAHPRPRPFARRHPRTFRPRTRVTPT
jgi:hypothetical protein